jgi:DNA polymerase-4/DNA polymerase V
MRVAQIRQLFPACVIANSDYELYGLFSVNMFTILRSFTPLVEEYSPDEGFADIQGLRRH